MPTVLVARRAVPLGAALAWLACSGEITGQSDRHPSAGAPGRARDDAPAPAAASTSTPSPPAGAAACRPSLERRLVRLSSRQYGNAVADLLGLTSRPMLSSGGAGSATFGQTEARLVTGAMAFELYQTAQQVAQSAVARLDALLACGGADERTCAQQFVTRFAARAFRRPLAADEAAALMRVYDAGRQADGTQAGGVELVIEAVLQSPSFLYRRELGTARAGAYQLDDFEEAAQIASLLLDSTPDDALWAAATQGRLTGAPDIAAQIDRLIALPRVRANLTDLVVRWLGTGAVTGIEKNAPGFTASLKLAMARESQLFVDDLLWQQRGTARDLLTSRRGFVDRELAAFYGVPAPPGTDFAPVLMPDGQRRGVLTHAALLATLASPSETSVVHRGLFVAGQLLCARFPPPPVGAVQAAQATLDALPTERARAEYRMQQPTCGGCHGGFDPFGVLFERYDETGRWRTTRAGQPVDASWDFGGLAGITGHVDDIVALADRLAAADALPRCLVDQMASALLADPQADGPPCELQPVIDRLGGGGRLADVFHDLAALPALALRKEATAP